MARSSGHGDVNLMSTIAAIYAAAEDAALWPALLDTIAGVLNGQSINLATDFLNADVSNIRVSARTDPAVVTQFVQYYAGVNVWAPRMDKVFAPGEIGFSHQAIPDAELHRTEFYDGWLRPNDFAYCMGAVLRLPHQPPALLTNLRSAGEGPFTEGDGRRLAALVPHLERSLSIHLELSTLRAAQQGLESALDAYGRAALGLSANGVVRFFNGEAARLLDRRDGIFLRAGRLAAEVPGCDTALQALLAAATIPGAAAQVILLARSSGQPPLRVSLIPLAAPAPGLIASLTTLLILDDPARAPLSRGGILRRLYGLTPTEARLADLLASGIDLRSAGERLRTSRETTRFHLRSIFRKTGLSRQTDLVRLVLGLPGETPPSSRKG